MTKKSPASLHISTKLVRRITAIFAVLALSVSLSACQGEVPQVKEGISTKPTPDLTAAHEKKIRSTILDVIARADSTHDENLLSQRVSGPARDIRASQIKIVAATHKADPRMVIPQTISQAVIPTDDGWPRTIFTVTTHTQDQQSRRLLVLKQDSARTNYKLWGLVRLFQGAHLPRFAVPSIGSQMGSLDDTGLIRTPRKAIEEYVDSLNKGTQSRYNKDITPDFFRSELARLTDVVQQGIARNHGTQQQTFTPNFDRVAIMRSSDGGDLVVAQLNSEWLRQAGGGGYQSLPASDAERTLFGNAQPTSKIKVSYVNVIALYVPPAGSDQRITAVGAERQPVKVEAL